MKKILIISFLLFFLVSCGGTYSPDCAKPEPGDWSSPERIVKFFDPVWGKGVLVLNTNVAGKYCYGFVTYVSEVSGPVKVIPIPRERGKSIISGLAYDRKDGVIFTGERSERKLYGVRYSDGKVIVRYSLDRNPLFVKYYDEIIWGGSVKKDVVALLTSATPSHNQAALYLWEASSLLQGKGPFASYTLKMKMPAGMIYRDRRFFIVPYDTGDLEIIYPEDGRKKLISFPYTSLSWGTTYITYCTSIDEICINSNSVKRILLFDYHGERWDGDVDLGMKTYNFQDVNGDLYLSSYDPPGVFRFSAGEKIDVYTPEKYSFVVVDGNRVYVSDFNGDNFKVIER